MDKLSLVDIKKKNYSDIYHFIYKHGKISKQSLAQGLQISLPTVNQHLNALMEKGLIQQCGQLQSQIGRRANVYSAVSQARTAIGVEVLKDQTTVVMIDLFGNVVNSRRFPFIYENSDGYCRQVSQCILEFIDASEIPHSKILGVGFGMQGLASSDGTQMTYSKILDTEGLTSQAFEQHVGLPCRLMHDSECAAVTTLWNSPEIQDSIYLSLAYHLGGAIIIHGEIQQGLTGKSGTIEHMTLIPNGRKCYCGQLGCAECYCSVDALLNNEEDLDIFFQKKNAGSTEHRKRWKKYLDYLAMLANNLHLVIECSIILGGHLAPYMQEEDFQYLHETIQKHTAFPEKESFLLQGSRYPDSVPIGAALKLVKAFLAHV